MIPFKSPPLGGPRPPLVQTYSGPLSDIGVPRPSGASTVIIEAIGYGGEGSYIELGGGSVQEFSGGGAAYARATIPAPVNGLRLTATTARGDYTTVVNVDSGLTVCRAQNGNRYVAGSAANSVGGVKFSGGAGAIGLIRMALTVAGVLPDLPGTGALAPSRLVLPSPRRAALEGEPRR
ncbi:hypothetical protein [Caulobacter phage S2B]|uniref:Uncharacterized protein n=1 Tax=Caulobacter phage S2B TaxID=2759120 RepID=A0AAE7MLD8_9CAUD|nr:hypothetical protein [Caulobacter phage S2B]